jgi:hypothetical protein
VRARRPATRQGLLLARVALAVGDHRALEHLTALPQKDFLNTVVMTAPQMTAYLVEGEFERSSQR